MPDAKGRYLPLSLPRRLVMDLMHFSQKVPLVPMERPMRLGPLVAARNATASRPSWCAIFLCAWARVAAERPALRRSYLGWPWPRLYEHPECVAAAAVEREFDGEDGVMVGLLHRPELMTLAEADLRLKHLKSCDPWDNALYRKSWRISALPWPLRRLAWWFGLEWQGKARAKNFGTFGVSATAGQGAGQLSLLSICTTTLHYGLFDEAGTIPMRITFDHRVLDGAPVARAMAAMEEVLLGPVLAELRGMQAKAA